MTAVALYIQRMNRSSDNTEPWWTPKLIVKWQDYHWAFYKVLQNNCTLCSININSTLLSKINIFLFGDKIRQILTLSYWTTFSDIGCLPWRPCFEGAAQLNLSDERCPLSTLVHRSTCNKPSMEVIETWRKHDSQFIDLQQCACRRYTRVFARFLRGPVQRWSKTYVGRGKIIGWFFA